MNRLLEGGVITTSGSFSAPESDSDYNDNNHNNQTSSSSAGAAAAGAAVPQPPPSERSHDSEGTEFTANPPRGEPVPSAWKNHHQNPSSVIPEYEVTPEDQGDGDNDIGEHPTTVGGDGTTVMHYRSNMDQDNDNHERNEFDEDDDAKSAGISTQPPSFRSDQAKKKSPLSNNNNNTHSPPHSSSPKKPKPKEVDFYRNPTILSRLILNQRYTNAIHRLRKHPDEASIWVCTKRQLPSDHHAAGSSSSPPKVKRNNSGTSGSGGGGGKHHTAANKAHRLSPRKLENTTLVFVQPMTTTTTDATTPAATTPTTTNAVAEDSASQGAQYDRLGRSMHSTISTISGPALSATPEDIAAAKAMAERATGSTLLSMKMTTTSATNTNTNTAHATTTTTPPKRHASTTTSTATSEATSSPPASPTYYYSLRQLPIHVACSNLFRHTDARLREQLEKLITHLVVVHPDGCMEVDHEGRLPLHEAIWHNCTAATVSILLMAAPETIHERDKYGKSPLELNLNRCAAITNSVGGGGSGSHDQSHLSTISNVAAAGVTANNMAMALQQLQEQRRIHDLLQKGVQFWEHAKQEAMLRMKHGGKPFPTSNKQPSPGNNNNSNNSNAALSTSLHSLGVKSVDSISVLAASSIRSEGSNTVWTADQSRDFGRAGSITDLKKHTKQSDHQQQVGSDRAPSSVPSSAATQRAVRTATTSSPKTVKDKDDATVEPLAWSQLEQRCLQLEQLLTEMYETNFELGEVIGALTRKKIELEDELELLVATDFAREAVSMRDDNMNLRKEVVRLQLLLQEHGIQDKQKNYYQNPYFSPTDNTQMEDIDPERRLEVIQYLDAKNRMLQQQVDEWTRSSHKFQRKSEQLEMVINSLHAMEDESVVTSKEEGSIASRSILETLKTDSSDATERYLAKRLTELDDRLAEAKQRSEEEQAVSREERLRLIRENEALVSELKSAATSNSNNNSPTNREKAKQRAVPTATATSAAAVANGADFAGDSLDVSYGKAPVVVPPLAPSTTSANDDSPGESRQDAVDEELDAIIRETELQTGLKIAPELVRALRQASFRKNSFERGPLGEASSNASRRLSFSSIGTDQPTLAEDELLSLIAEAEKESGLTIPSELISALRRTSLSNNSVHSLSQGGDQTPDNRSFATRQSQDQPSSLPALAPIQKLEPAAVKRNTPSAAQEQKAVARSNQNQPAPPKASELETTRAVGKQTNVPEKRSSPERTARGAATAIAMMAAKEKGPAPEVEATTSKESDSPAATSPPESSTLQGELIASGPSRETDARSVSSYQRQFNDDDLDFLLREIEREFGEPIPPDVVHALRRASTQSMLSSLSEESGMESQESNSHASFGRREFTSFATSASPLSDNEVDRMLAEAEGLLGRPLSSGLIRAIRTASASLASFTTPSTSTYTKDESPRSNERSSSEGRVSSGTFKEKGLKHPPLNESVERSREATGDAENASNNYDGSNPDSERDVQNLINEAEALYGGPLSPEIIAALKSKQSITGSDEARTAADLDVGEEDIESIIREAERLQGMPLSADLINALRAVSFHDDNFDAGDSYFRDYTSTLQPEKANISFTELRTSPKTSSLKRRSPKGNTGKLDKLLSNRSSESEVSGEGGVSRPLQPPERQLSTFTLVSVSSSGSTDLQDISGFDSSMFQGQLDQVSELDDEANQDETDRTEISDSDLALLIEKAYESQGRTIPSDLLNAISAASLQDADDPEDLDGVISQVERLYGKALPNEVTEAVREASQMPHLGDVDELDVVLEEAERMYGGQLSSFVKKAWRGPSSSSSSSLSFEFVEEAKRIYGNPIPDELSEALMIGVSQSSLDLGIDQELDRIILDAEHMYGAELPSDLISALRQASVQFSSSRFSLRSLLDSMDMPSIAEDTPLHGEDDSDIHRHQDDEDDGQFSSDDLHAVFAEAAKMLGSPDSRSSRK